MILENFLHEDLLPSFVPGLPYDPTCLQTCLVTTVESYSCGAPGDEETRRHRLCSNVLGPEAKQMGRELEAISSAGMRTSLTFLCVQLKNVDLKQICCKELND